MASVHRQRGRPYWFISYFDQEGRRRHKSSKTTSRKEAEIFAAAVERAARAAKYGPFTQARARKVIEETIDELATLSGSPIERQTARQYFENWLEGKQASEGTLNRYRGIVERFLSSLGERARGSLHGITDSDVQKFRDALKRTVASGTVNTYLKVLRVALNRAVKKNLLERN